MLSHFFNFACGETEPKDAAYVAAGRLLRRTKGRGYTLIQKRIGNFTFLILLSADKA
jgi:hypothetical protein